jgi:hypothetical protein
MLILNRHSTGEFPRYSAQPGHQDRVGEPAFVRYGRVVNSALQPAIALLLAEPFNDPLGDLPSS